MTVASYPTLALVAAIVLSLYNPGDAFVVAPVPAATRSVKSVPIPQKTRIRVRTPGWGMRSRGTALNMAADAANGIQEAKENLKRALKDNYGSTGAADVMAAVEALCMLNPTPEPGRAWPLLSGDWQAIGEDFVGTTRNADGMQCTLGRLAFNMYRPVDLPLLVEHTTNLVGSAAAPASGSDAEEGGESRKFPDYIITSRFSTREGGPGRTLSGRSVLYGSCVSDPDLPQRVLVWFSSGVLEPNDGQDLAAWRDVINVADRGGNGDGGLVRRLVGPFSRLGGKAVALGMKLALGIKPPAAELGSKGELSFEMTRSPKGLLDVLFLDEEMRITRGQKGSIVVATRRL